MGSKIKDIGGNGGGAWRKYCEVTHGPVGLWRALRNELLVLLFNNVPGALGLALRRIFYPCMFRSCGRGVVFGRAISLRHACKISLGDRVIIDDDAMLDAKGDANKGITIGDGVFVGRSTKIYCKGGDITLCDRVNISSLCTIYSGNALTIGAGCMIGAYTYILSAGEYDSRDPTPYADQAGDRTRGPLTIGADCWIGARATILDAAQSIGDRALVAACALVNRPVSAGATVAGIPARPLERPAERQAKGEE